MKNNKSSFIVSLIFFVTLITLILKFLKKQSDSTKSIKKVEKRSKLHSPIIPKPKVIPLDSISQRQKKIMSIFENNFESSLTLDQIKSEFKTINVRTLRRDLQKLVENKMIKKTGNTKGSFYTKV